MTENTEKRRGGRTRSKKKQSYMAKFIATNREHFGNGSSPDYTKVKEVR